MQRNICGGAIASCLAVVPISFAQSDDGGGQQSPCGIREYLAQFPIGCTCYRPIPRVDKDWKNLVVREEDIVSTPKKGRWIIIDPYACGLFDCDEIVVPEPWEHTEETELQVCVSAGSTLTVEGGLSLRSALLGKLGVQIKSEWNLSINGCYTTRKQDTYTMPWFQCYPTRWRETWIESVLSGYIEEAYDQRIFEVDAIPPCDDYGWQSVSAYCQ